MYPKFVKMFITMCLFSLMIYGITYIMHPYDISIGCFIGFGFVIIFSAIISFKTTQQAYKGNKKAEDENILIIKEVNHRIKNNIGILTNIIDLKKFVYSDPEIQDLLNDLRDKTLLVSNIHEKIYESCDIKSISIKSYIEDVINMTNNFYNNIVKVNYNIDEVGMRAKNAIDVVLIIQEFFTNAVKYAYKDTDEKLFSIELKHNCFHYTITIRDNGKGFDNLDLNNADSFGLKMVMTIIDQYDGKIELENDGGAVARIFLNID